ncbi:MAG TPA: sugar phosphate isomerase/epimerase family protein [Gaiellaceae bacterium]|nr:sugar phosphate isomerase/epimerase family protein [Gaiellaceae bacterium]
MSRPSSITLRAFPPEQPLDRCLRVARKAGFDAVEVNLEPGLPYELDSPDAAIAELGSLIRAHGLAISSLHSREQWRFPITSSRPAVAAEGKRVVRRLAECAKLLDVDAILVVAGGVDMSLLGPDDEVVPYDAAYERAQEALAELAREVDVLLCIENVWTKFLLSPLEFRRFVDELDHPLVGVYFDVGNVLAHGYPEQWIRILGSRIKRVHIKDYKRAVGTEHGFTGLLQGDVDWPEVMAALREIGYDSYLTAEVLPPYPHDPFQLVYDCATALRKLEALDAAPVPGAAA